MARMLPDARSKARFARGTPEPLSWVETMQSRERNSLLTTPPELTLGELEPLAGALLAVLLPLVSARVARQESELLQFAAKFRIEFH
jgi:hypothetical protein